MQMCLLACIHVHIYIHTHVQFQVCRVWIGRQVCMYVEMYTLMCIFLLACICRYVCRCTRVYIYDMGLWAYVHSVHVNVYVQQKQWSCKSLLFKLTPLKCVFVQTVMYACMVSFNQPPTSKKEPRESERERQRERERERQRETERERERQPHRGANRQPTSRSRPHHNKQHTAAAGGPPQETPEDAEQPVAWRPKRLSEMPKSGGRLQRLAPQCGTGAPSPNDASRTPDQPG